MGQLNRTPKIKVEKTDINLDYQTYGREGDIDYAVDYNGEYQPSDYDEMYDTMTLWHVYLKAYNTGSI